MEKEHDLAKWLAGEMSEAERIAFEQTPDFAMYQRIASASSKLSAPGFDEEAMLKHITQQPKKQSKPKVLPLYIKATIRVAAVIAIAIGVWVGTRDGKATNMTLAQAVAGSTKTLLLPDQSEVTLNSGSTLAFDQEHWDSKRETRLTGEAFFHVSKGRRFDVLTDLGKVTVVGTQFDVKVRENRFEVACFEGKVLVQSKDFKRLITKGEIIAFENGQLIKVSPENAGTPGWMRNELVFKSESLSQVIAELERHFAVKINLPKEHSAALFTGILPGNDPASALQLICNTYKLKTSHQKGNTIDLLPAVSQ